MTSSKPIKLNLGCGFDHRRGYINIDVDRKVKPNLVADLRRELPFPRHSVSEILLQDTLEHLTQQDAMKLLRRCEKVLRISGKLIVRVPNVFAIFRKYFFRPDILMLFLYGDTSRNGEWGAHKYGYTPQILRRLINGTNLELIGTRTEDTNYIFELIRRDRPVNLARIELLSWWQQLLTPYFISPRSLIVWKITQPYPTALAKTIYRLLSIWVDEIRVSKQSLITFVKDQLHFSHLRITSQKINQKRTKRPVRKK